MMPKRLRCCVHPLLVPTDCWIDACAAGSDPYLRRLCSFPHTSMHICE